MTTSAPSEPQVDLTLAAAASGQRRHRAIAYWHALLERHDVPAYAQWLQEALRGMGALFGERLICPFLRPHFVTRQQLELLRAAVRDVVGAMQVLGPVIAQSPELQERLGLTDEERRLCSVDPGYPELSVTSRLDSFLIGGRLHFVEYNAECPAGIGYGDIMMDTFLRSEVMQEFIEEFPCRPMFCSDRLLGALLETYRRWGGNGKPVIGIVDYEGLPTRYEFEIFKRFFASRGYECVVSDPRALEFDGQNLRLGDTRINLVYRRLLTNEYLERFDQALAVWEAYRAGKICLINNFRAKFLHKKAIFSLLTDSRFQQGFTPQQLEGVRRHVPWTRKVEDVRSTDKDGNDIELLAYIRKFRKHLVMKPNDEYGGKGIFVGWERTDSQWEEDIQKALQSFYVVQWRVDVGREHYPVWDGQKVSWGEYTVDLDPYVFGTDVAGLLTRLAASSLCNVTAGGGVVPCFVLT
ncbi:MAG TPA: hypothetical protein VNO81_03220 [Candidatus Nitrosotenuis sp.]|jgi:hypothetical protein|nr:hypothetical protein [Candidatus Nitrosotenuis sp.]